MVIKYKIRGNDWLTFSLIIVNFNHFFIQLAPEVWYVFRQTQCKRLQKLQNRSARIIMNTSDHVESTVALNALGWEPLEAERRQN